MITAVLVEDEPLWQQAIAALIDTSPSITLLSTVDNAHDAIVEVQKHQPTVLLLDWKINGPKDGLELAKELHQNGQYKPQQLIMITGSPREQLGEQPYGYVPKPAIAEMLLDAIEEAIIGL